MTHEALLLRFCQGLSKPNCRYICRHCPWRVLTGLRKQKGLRRALWNLNRDKNRQLNQRYWVEKVSVVLTSIPLRLPRRPSTPLREKLMTALADSPQSGVEREQASRMCCVDCAASHCIKYTRKQRSRAAVYAPVTRVPPVLVLSLAQLRITCIRQKLWSANCEYPMTRAPMMTRR